MDINRNNYERQANSLNNGNINNLSNNTKINEQPFTNNFKVGRNEPKPVRMDDGTYNLTSNVDYKSDNSFTHTMMNLDTKILEEQNAPEDIVTVEPIDDNVNEEVPNNNDNEPKKKSLFMKIVIIGLIIELIVIVVVGLTKLLTGSKTTDILSCGTSIVDDSNGANIEIENLYYFKKSGNYKRESITKYTFASKEVFDKFKKDYVDDGIYDIAGLSYENSFNTSDMSYTSKVIYDYSKMKKDKKNKSSNNNRITIVDESGNTLLDIEISDINILMSQNKEQGYVCSLK